MIGSGFGYYFKVTFFSAGKIQISVIVIGSLLCGLWKPRNTLKYFKYIYFVLYFCNCCGALHDKNKLFFALLLYQSPVQVLFIHLSFPWLSCLKSEVLLLPQTASQPELTSSCLQLTDCCGDGTQAAHTLDHAS